LLAVVIALGCTTTRGVPPGADPTAARDAAQPPGLDARAGDPLLPDARVPDAATGPTVPAPPPDADVPVDASAARDAQLPIAGNGVIPTPPDSSAPDAAVLATSLRCDVAGSYGDPLPALSERHAARVRDGFGFIEGPLWIPSEGVLLFSDIDFATNGNPQGPSSRIRRFRPPDQFDVLVESSGSNGLALALDGRVLAATHDLQTLSYFDPANGARESRMLSYAGKRFNSPNDLTVRSDGNVYFTDPDWQLGSRASETSMRGLYRAAPDGSVQLLDASLDNPNGVALSPDEATLYVGSRGSEVFAFPLAADGGAGPRRVFASTGGGGSDGMGIDCAGNLYVTSGKILVFSPAGQKLGEITTDENPSNVAFGGLARKTLYITGGPSLFQIELNVPGRAY